MKEFPGLYKRGKTYWLAVQRQKVRRYISLETDDLSLAIVRAREISDHPAVVGDRLSNEVLRYLNWKRAKGRFSRASFEAKGAVLKTFARRLSGKYVPAITTKNITDFYHDTLEAGRSPDTANSYLSVLSGFFEWAKSVQQLVKVNPVSGIERVKTGGRARLNFCSPAVRDQLIAECPREDLRFALYCGFHAGLRFNEIIQAKAFWFDLNARILHLRKHPGIDFKDREERSIPLSRAFTGFIEEYGLREPYMLRPEKKGGRSIYRYDFERPFREYMKAQGHPWITPHVMRHTFASLLASKGVSIYLIAEWLGDEVRTVQKHYAKLLPMHDQIERMM